MNKTLAKQVHKAREEGRLCTRCGWIVTKRDFQKGHLLCSGCRDAMANWRIGGFLQPAQEPEDKTGEML